MGHKTINLPEVKKCPKCGSKYGLVYYIQSKTECLLQWGDDPWDSAVSKTVITGKSVKSAKCRECGQRFIILGE